MKFNGLSDKEVEQSRGQYGSNQIPDSEPTTFWEEFNRRAAWNDRGSACCGVCVGKDRRGERYQVP